MKSVLHLFQWLTPLGVLWGLTACYPEKEIDIDTGDTGTLVDSDGDGYDDWEDCEPDDAGVHPGAMEICDERDNDCDGEVDEAVTTTYFTDADGDGFGDATTPIEACEQPDGTVPQATDCDDTDAGIHPGAVEICDGVDNDCDGFVDDDDTDSQTVLQEWYFDWDGDGYGDEDASTQSCAQPSGYVSNDDDCNDNDPDVSPAAVEICDELNVDEDCDGTSDDDDTTVDPGTLVDWWQDGDGDGYGDPSGATTIACDQPTGYAPNTTDCDDTNGDVNPGEREVCGDGIDNNCDISDDEDPNDWYPDDDEDSYGDSSGTALTQCTDPSDSGGCSDGDMSTTCYVPDDNADCDDTDSSVNPAATEICDSIDNDCDGDVDPSTSADAVDWWLDADGDTYGDSASSTVSCTEPSGYVDNDDDCDDTDSTINPDASEVCDAADIDEDCNGSADDADSGTQSSSMSTWYLDADADGYGELSSTTTACDEPSGYVADNSDCNDSDSAINPGATEVCDSSDTDEDCDGAADDDDTAVDTSTLTTFYADTDGDGYGDSSSTGDYCDQPTGYVTDSSDCDDADSAINPGATEVCDDADTDEDCDGTSDDDDTSVDSSTLSTWYQDSDGDGFGDSSSVGYACDQPTGYVEDDTDCDDADSSITSGEWYPDSDGDGYGDDSASVTSTCTPPSGYVTDHTDCDDADSAISPEAHEAYYDLATDTETNNCSDGDDNDCNGDADTSDEACDDIDGDGLIDGLQLAFPCDVDDDGYDDGWCMAQAYTDQELTGTYPWVGTDTITSTSYPWSSITLSSAEAEVSASMSWGGHTWDSGVALVTHTGGYSQVRCFSAIGSDGSSTVDTSDTTDWVDCGMQSYCDAMGGDTDWCANTSISGSTVYYFEGSYSSSTGELTP